MNKWMKEKVAILKSKGMKPKAAYDEARGAYKLYRQELRGAKSESKNS